MKVFKILTKIFVLVFFLSIAYLGYLYYQKQNILKQVIERFQADSRIAQVLVSDVAVKDGREYTTIKFLEYDLDGNPLAPKYFTFSGNMIQFQSLVIRFEDTYISKADRLKGKSVYLFWKAFVLNGKNTQDYEITPVNSVPQGYMVSRDVSKFEKELWRQFWDYALRQKVAKGVGIKNAQIEAPGTKFVPGLLYTIKIEHDGGMRIDSENIPEILLEEKDKIYVKLGEEFTVTLDSNPTTGYQWEIMKQDKNIVEFIDLDFSIPDNSLVGAPGKQIFTFKAKRQGKVKLAFEYCRPWEKGAAAERKEFEIFIQ